jgi:F0F1-type ATP synthase epsilon subunit
MTADKLTVLTTRAVAGSDIVQDEAQKELTAAQASTSGNLAEMDQITRQRDRARLKVRVAQSGAGRGI